MAYSKNAEKYYSAQLSVGRPKIQHWFLERSGQQKNRTTYPMENLSDNMRPETPRFVWPNMVMTSGSQPRGRSVTGSTPDENLPKRRLHSGL